MKPKQESTIYHFTLARKVRPGPGFAYSYAVFFVILAGLAVMGFGLKALAAVPLDLAAVLALHRLLLGGLLRYSERGAAPITWRFSLAYPLLGFLPGAVASASRWYRLTVHVLIVGSLLPCLFYPWVAPVWWVPAIGLHLWLQLPMLWIRVRFRGLRSEAGLLRFQDGECSFYYS